MLEVCGKRKILLITSQDICDSGICHGYTLYYKLFKSILTNTAMETGMNYLEEFEQASLRSVVVPELKQNGGLEYITVSG